MAVWRPHGLHSSGMRRSMIALALQAGQVVLGVLEVRVSTAAVHAALFLRSMRAEVPVEIVTLKQRPSSLTAKRLATRSMASGSEDETLGKND